MNAHDPDINARPDKQRAETNLEARKKLIAELMQEIRARRSLVYPFHENPFVAQSTRVVGLHVYADRMPPLKTAGLAER